MKKMNPFRVPITISPHVVEGKPRGYYIIVHSLWKDKQPIIFRDQFVGFHKDCLIFSMAHPSEWSSFPKVVIHTAGVSELPRCWLSSVRQTRMGTGVRFYLPGTILKPASLKAKAVETIGAVYKAVYGSGDLIYVSIPIISGDILLGRGELGNVE